MSLSRIYWHATCLFHFLKQPKGTWRHLAVHCYDRLISKAALMLLFRFKPSISKWAQSCHSAVMSLEQHSLNSQVEHSKPAQRQRRPLHCRQSMHKGTGSRHAPLKKWIDTADLCLLRLKMLNTSMFNFDDESAVASHPDRRQRSRDAINSGRWLCSDRCHAG